MGLNQDRTVWCRFIYSLLDARPEFEHIDPLEVCQKAGVTRKDIFLKDKIDRGQMLSFLVAAIESAGPDLVGISANYVEPIVLGPAGLIFQAAPTMSILLRDLAAYKNLYAPGAVMTYREGRRNLELEIRFPALQDSLVADLWVATVAGVVDRLTHCFPHAHAVRFAFSTKGSRFNEHQKTLIKNALGGCDEDTRRIKLGDIKTGPGPSVRIVVPINMARKENFVFPGSTYDDAWILANQFSNADYKTPTLPDRYTTAAKMESLLLTVGRTLTKEQIADRLNMSAKTLERKLKEEVDLTFKQHRALIISKIVQTKIAAGLGGNDLARQLGFKSLAQLETTLKSIPLSAAFR